MHNCKELFIPSLKWILILEYLLLLQDVTRIRPMIKGKGHAINMIDKNLSSFKWINIACNMMNTINYLIFTGNRFLRIFFTVVRTVFIRENYISHKDVCLNLSGSFNIFNDNCHFYSVKIFKNQKWYSIKTPKLNEVFES